MDFYKQKEYMYIANGTLHVSKKPPLCSLPIAALTHFIPGYHFLTSKYIDQLCPVLYLYR